MDKRKRKSLAPVKVVVASDIHRETFVDDGLRKRVVLLENKINGKWVALPYVCEVSTSTPSMTIFEQRRDEIVPAEYPGFEPLANECRDDLSILVDYCHAEIGPRVSGRTWQPKSEAAEQLYRLLLRAFSAGKNLGLLEVAREALAGKRQAARNAKGGSAKKLPRNELKRRWDAVQKELANQAKRKARLSRERAYAAVAKQMGLATVAVKKSCLEYSRLA